ncbi:mitofilin family membrane protein [Paraurantiacibacter namhicola]|uniref:Mitochondrial inner membrane protein n=1 Tax=Paraurantiacibacter namhicola TaxID=645517 RepID=A0A1C7D7B8_9SPHN|nr:mitofilin family membrane protein [Paraurantiacibacter namhicola]ANU07369.1 Mitochondrial inner membrane protein [Paraurantiacibacter namhicola]
MDMYSASSARPSAARERGPAGTARLMTLVALGSFLLGAVAIGVMTWDSDHFGDGTIFRVRSDGMSPAAAATLPARTGATDDALVENVITQQGGLDQRLAALEQRLSSLDLRAEAAAGNAARAEGLLIAFATRRALDRGAPLGYLADQLRLRFGESKPNAVQAILDFEQDPVTKTDLLTRLDSLSAALQESPGDEGVFPWLSREMGSLFRIRSEDTPSPLPQRRLERARMYLEVGDVDKAVAEVKALPNAVAAADWISDAGRYGRVQQALDVIETAAVLETRGLKDGSGEEVETPGAAQTLPRS